MFCGAIFGTIHEQFQPKETKRSRALSSFGTALSVPSGTWTDINEDGDADPGETIIYSLEISNAGIVSLYNMTVFSDTIGADSIECPPLPESGLSPGVTVTCAATYKVCVHNCSFMNSKRAAYEIFADNQPPSRLKKHTCENQREGT